MSAPIVFAHVALGRVSARFALAYPEVLLEVVAEDRKVDPVEDGYDLVIRINPSPDEQRLVGRRILYDQRLVVAPSGLRRPTTAAAAAKEEIPVKAVMLTNTPAEVPWRLRTHDNRNMTLRPNPVLRFSSLLMVRDAVLAGAGVALLPKLLVEDDVDAGRLAQWGTEEGPPVEIWALQSSRRLVGAKVRAFLDVVEKTFPNKVFVKDGAAR